MRVPRLEKKLGIEVYASRSPGIGGRIRRFPEDFVVEEILVDGSKAEVSQVEVQRSARRGRYLICVMVKRGWDTLLAVKTVARQLRISGERINIAGIKDAKALTAQHISIGRFTPEQVSGVKIKDITLHPLRFADEKISSELLMANEFHIVIRAIPHKASTVEQRVEKVQNELSTLGGVPNFFGHQRFGTVRPITHLVGYSLLREEWKRAVLTFLAAPSPHEHPESREARQRLGDNEDFSKAVRYFPANLKYEHLMLRHLARRPNDFVGALRRLPRKLCKLFVQAYQSYIFNRALSERFRRCSLTEAYVGDYVVTLGKQGLARRESKQVTTQTRPSIQEALDKNKMRVCIPLIGFKQGTSEGVQGEIEHEILEGEGVEPENFHIAAMPEISAAGRLRPVLVPIINLSTDAISKDATIPSMQTIGLNFMLHRGSYATVVLREFIKPRDLIRAGF